MTSGNTKLSKYLIEKKLGVLEYSLENDNSWRVDTAIKNYLKSTLFSLADTNSPKNHVFDSDLWSARCYYSSISAFNNLLDKHQINEKSKVLLHPLLPAEYIDIIVSRGSSIITCDIDVTNLAFDKKLFENTLIVEKNNLSLIIHFNDDGLYQPVQNLLKLSKNSNASSMIIVNNQTITQDLIALTQTQGLSSFIWNAGPCFSDTILNTVIKEPLKQTNWTFSWYIETIAKPIKADFSGDQILYKQVIQEYYRNLLSTYRQYGVSTMFYTFLHKTARKIKHYNEIDNHKKILNSIENILLSEIPDLVFQIEKIDNPESDSKIQKNHIYKVSSDIKMKTNSLENMLDANIKALGKDTDKLIPVNPNYTYLKYFFYPADKQLWANWAFKKNLKIYELQPLNHIFSTFLLPNANMVSDKIVYFDTVDILL
jgi:hypothetical protein